MNSADIQAKAQLIRPLVIQTPPFNSSSPRIPLNISTDPTPGPGAYGIPKLDEGTKTTI